MLANVLVVGLVLAAAITDARRHKIYNWNTYTGIVAALALNAAAQAAVAAGVPEDRVARIAGHVGLAECLAGFLACGFAMLVCFVLFRIGGGDVKLMAMIGAFLGLERGVQALLWTFVLGGCLGLVLLIWRVGALTLAARAARQVLSLLRLGGFAPLTDEERSQLQPPLFLAPCALAAVLLVQFSWFE